MAVRQFNGTSDYLRVDNGTIGQIGNGAFTLLVVAKPTALNAGECYIACENGGSLAAGLFDNSADPGQLAVADDGVYLYGTVNEDLTWQILAVTVTGAGVAPRLHRKELGAGSWTHANSGAGNWAGNTVATANVEFGSFNDGDFSSYKDCRLAVGAVWNSALSDANLESIQTTPATQTIYDLAPLSLWDFNQADVATDVLDLMGNGADEVAISGTTVVTGDDPPGWTFGIGGEEPSERTFVRMVGPSALSAAAADLYTVPATTRARILHIHASNPSGSPIDLTLSVGTDAAATRVYDDFEIAANSIEHNYDPYDLAAGEKIQGFAGTAGTLVVTISGYEEPE